MKAGIISESSCRKQNMYTIVCETPEEAHMIATALCFYGQMMERAEEGPDCLAGNLGGQLVDIGFESVESAPTTWPWKYGRGFDPRFMPATVQFREAIGLQPNWEGSDPFVKE